MAEVYKPGQARVLFDFWPAEAEWFIVGGPADGDEMSTIRAQYPNVKCIGFEPCNAYYGRYTNPLEPVHPYALWSENRDLLMSEPAGRPRSSSVVLGEFPCQHTRYSVAAVTLDDLSEKFGPFNNAVLWLDIEYAELEALHGAWHLLMDSRVLMINLETYDHLRADISDYLHAYDFEEVMRWNTKEVMRWNTKCIGGRFDIIYKRR